MNEYQQQVFAAMIAAPASEIDAMYENRYAEAAEVLGIPAHEYNYKIHYVELTAKFRKQWALAMIKEANYVLK